MGYLEHLEDEKMCGRCYDVVDEVLDANCAEKPEDMGSLGMYHCPDCGAMILGGIPHPQLCRRCFDRVHPAFDKEGYSIRRKI
jgi:hypothetical protein